MAKHPHVLHDREKSLEEQFFARQSDELRTRLREKQERERMREELRRIAVIKREETIERMLELGITPATWAAISLIPLVEVAWANGRVDAKERRAVLAAAELNGVTPGSPGHQMLDGWLGHRPDGRLLQAWGEYMVELCAALKPGEKRALRDELLGRSRQVAEAAGGFLGLGNKISPEEQVVLDELAKVFEG